MSNKNESPDGFEAASDNEQIRLAVCEGLGQSGHCGLRAVLVRVDDDRIVLTGTVPSYFLKQVAQEAARRACPNRRVYNELDVPQSA